jgi:thiol:disulfide interchange protein DsbD
MGPNQRLRTRHLTVRATTLNRPLFAFLCLFGLSLLPTGGEASDQAPSALQDFRKQGVQTHDDFLPVDEAFVVSARPIDSRTVALSWIIAPGYYLYRSKITVVPDDSSLRIGKIELPAGKLKHDDYFGDTQVYYEVIDARLPITAVPTGKKASLKVTYQGCAEEGLCYNPVTKTVAIAFP